MISESVIACYSTLNYQLLTDICISSLISIGFKEDQIKHLLDNITNNKPPVRSLFRKNIWFKSIINKVIHLKSVIQTHIGSTYKYVIFTDCDIRYIKKNGDKWDELKQYMETTPYDVYFTDDRCGGNVNSGFYIVKLNANIQKMVRFFEIVIADMRLNNKSEDQIVINKYKHTINYGYIPQDYIILGTAIINKDKALLHHAVCEGSITGKIAQMDDIQRQVDPIV